MNFSWGVPTPKFSFPADWSLKLIIWGVYFNFGVGIAIRFYKWVNWGERPTEVFRFSFIMEFPNILVTVFSGIEIFWFMGVRLSRLLVGELDFYLRPK
jgi:hypothetical protein